MSYLQSDGLLIEDDSASAVTVVEGRKMNATVSFMDWGSKSHDFGGGKRKSLDLERMGSGFSCGDSSGSGEYVSRFSKNGLENGSFGYWLEQMQIQQRHDMGGLVNLKHPSESIRYRYLEERGGAVENKGSPVATGEEKSLRAQVSHSKGSPGVTGEEKSQVCHSKGSPGATGEEKSRRVHMFDKAVTPSDVGKLNRLVIPKHHAEKYFPLDTSEKDKGLLLTFRDSAGKEWRFRYSYWSSSQSYVLTKGWSRFVREMKLHAGDVVSFHRAADSQNMQQHFYISWKRRAAKAPIFFSPFQQAKSPPPATPSQWMSFASAMPAAPPPWAERISGRPPIEENWGREPPQFMKLIPVQQPPAENATEKPIKRVRLFGVNL